MTNHQRRVVFFDLDGTLHQQDMFGSFIRYLLRRQPLNALLVLPLLPVIALALLIQGRAARWPMSLLLWGCTFGRSEARLKAHQADFVRWFRSNVTAFPLVQQRLTTYLLSSDADIWLITGSPQSLVEQVYFDTPWLPRVNLIASKMARGYGGWVLTLRCLGHEKVTQLGNRLAHRCLSTAATATVSRIIRYSLFASIAGASRRAESCNNSNRVNDSVCV